MIISGPHIYTENGVIKNADVIIRDNKIHAIDTEKKSSSDDRLIFPEHYHLVPGFIDVHIHGANGCDVMDGTEIALDKISQALAAEGTTAFLATTMTASTDQIADVVKNAGNYIQKQKMNGARLLGVHLEGPFLSPQKVGAQSAKHLLSPQINLIRDWQKQSGNAIKLVTVAPELPNSLEFIHFLKTEKIIASMGHTNATYQETLAAIDAGCSHVTHLFNAMRGIHQREPGIAIAALLSETVSTELILDEAHLHPAIVDLVFKIKHKEKIILVTDAMRAKCLPDGLYDLGGQSVSVKQNKASLADGTLAGSVLKMSTAIHNMMRFTHCTLLDAVRFASANPAKLLGLFDTKGSIALQKDADLVVLDEALNIVLTMVEGKIVYRKDSAVFTASIEASSRDAF